MASNGVTAWSFSRWETFDTCAYQFACGLDPQYKHMRTQSPAKARGDAIHKEAAHFITTPDAPFPASLAKFDALMWELHDMPADVKVVEQQWAFDRKWRPTGWFDRGTGTTWFRNILDAGVVYPDHSGDVIDHKTGKEYEKNAEQRELNAVSMLQRYPHLEVVTSRMWYLDSGVEREVTIGRHELPKLVAKWEKRADAMFNEKVWAPRPNEKCKWCDFAKSKGGPCKFG